MAHPQIRVRLTLERESKPRSGAEVGLERATKGKYGLQNKNFIWSGFALLGFGFGLGFCCCCFCCCLGFFVVWAFFGFFFCLFFGFFGGAGRGGIIYLWDLGLLLFSF